MGSKGQSHQDGASNIAQPGVTPRAQFDLIWNTTLVCPWDCGICCVDAVHVVGDGGNVKLRSQGLQRTEVIEAAGGGTKYDMALRHLQAEGRELTWEKKLALLENIKGESVRLDISGGDALVVREGRDLLREVSRRLGSHNVTLTVTGAGLRKQDIAMAVEAIGEFNFTYDPGTADTTQLRPAGYATSNLQLAKHMAKLGVPVRAEMPLTRFAISKQTLEKAYMQLADAGVQHLLLMRLFAVGRGLVNEHAIPTRREYLEAIDILQNCAARMKGPKVKLQCALRHIAADAGFAAVGKNPCDLVTESFGLMADGTLLASPWAIGPTGAPLDPSFVLGNLAESQFAQLRAGAVAKELARRANDNFGHCKIFAWQHSQHADPVARMTDKADPLFADDKQGATTGKKHGIVWVKPEPK
jgi:hypothetical protein